MSGVFISYRREDSSGYAGRLFDILSVHFGKENTYMDVDTIKGGDNFAVVIEDKLSQCKVLLAVIGERWLTSTGENGSRRLDVTGDFVRLEIAKALERGVRVIPVLVGGATMPHQEDLPNDLRPLAFRQAMELRDTHFAGDAEQLIEVLKETDPRVANRLWPVKSKRFTATVLFVLAVAGAGAILLFRQGKPAAPATPSLAAEKQISPPNRPILKAQASPVGADQSRNPAKPLADVAGKWNATVTYDWPNSTSAETFNFDVDGAELSGTASFLKADRAIVDGKIEGDRIRFTTKSLTELDGKTYEDKQNYKGIVERGTIRFTMLIDSSISEHPPFHFTATRAGAR